MDETNKKILAVLRQNSRTPFLRISKDLNVSEGTVRKRVETLLKKGVIRRFTIEESLDTSAIIHIMTATNIGTTKISEELMKIKGVLKIYEITGKYSIYCLIKGNSLYDINDTVEEIRQMKGVLRTETHSVLKEY